MKKRLLALLLCGAMLAACIPMASAASYWNLADWAKDDVEMMESQGFLPESILNGDMNASISRKEMCYIAAYIFASFGDGSVTPSTTENAFTDTNDPVINFAAENGIVSGYEDNTFRPNQLMTRQEFFKTIWTLMGLCYVSIDSLPKSDLSQFSDVGEVYEYALESARVLAGIGILRGSDDGRIHPQDTASRQEAVVMFARSYTYTVNWIAAKAEGGMESDLQRYGITGVSPWAVREVTEFKAKGLLPKSLQSCNMSNGITRGQMCSIAVLAYNKAKGTTLRPSGGNYFWDTNDDDVNICKELGIVDGSDDGGFHPNDPLTREQFFKILAKFMNAVGYPRTDYANVNLNDFADGYQVADFAKAPTRMLVFIGAVKGSDGLLEPTRGTSIQEGVVLFLRCYKYAAAWMLDHPNGDANDELRADLCAYASIFEGYPYVYGASGPNSFDCSGFTMYVYKNFGINLKYHGAQEQFTYAKEKAYAYGKASNVLDEMKPGDLVFFTGQASSTTNIYEVKHVGIYLGDGRFIHAANPSAGVKIDSLVGTYYGNRLFGYARYIVTQG